MKIKKLPVGKIKEYANNPRINDESVAKVKESIRDFGYINLIAVDKNNVIVVGHTRFKALKELGYKTIEVFVLDLPEKKIQEYRLIDNKAAELAGWNIDFLAAELREIGEDMQKFTDTFNIEALLLEDIGGDLKAITDEDIQKEEKKLEQSAPYTKFIYQEITCPKCNDVFTVRIK